MPRTFRLFLAASLGVLVAGCDKSTNSDMNVHQNTVYGGAKDTGHVFVLMRDQVSGAPLAGVKASLLGDSAIVKTTDSAGWLDFSGIGPGTRLLRVEKSGYAGRIVSVTLADGSSDVPRLMDVSVDLNLPRLGASATGKVYYTDRNGNDFPVINDTLDVYFATPGVGTWISGHSVVVTDSQGFYSVSGLPEDIGIQISPRSVKMGGTVLSTATKGMVSGLKSGESRFVPVFTLTANVESFDLLSDNLASVALTDSVVLTFSQPVDTNALRKGDITDSAGGYQVAATATWSVGATKLTLRPFSGKWTSGTNSLTLNLKSTQGVAFAKSLTFVAGTVSALPGEAGSISYTSSYNGRDTGLVNSNTGSVKFKWGRASGADGYEIYKKNRGDNSFVKVASTSKGTDCELSFNTTNYFAKGDTVTFLVLATNAKGSAALSGAPTVTLTDKIRPQLTGAPGEFHLDSVLNNTSGNQVREIGRVNFSFSEDMDTSMSAEISFNNKDSVVFDATGKLVMNWVWDTKSTGHVFLGAKAGKDASGLNAELSVSLANFKDENGNTFISPLQADWLILVAK